MSSASRLGSEFVAAFAARYGARKPEARPLTYDIAVNPEFEHWRAWYDQQLALLPEGVAAELMRKLWLDESFWPVTFELAAGAALRGYGHEVEYEREYPGKLTPDWTVLHTDGKPRAIVEVVTDQPPNTTFGQLRAWRALEERIATIPVGVTLVLRGHPHRAPRPPDSGTARRIAHTVRERLLGSAYTSLIKAEGYTFGLLQDRYGPVASANGIRAQFLTPSGVASPVDARRVARGVDSKVKKYAELARSCDVPLMVAAGAHRFTGVGLDNVDALLSGATNTQMQFNIGDTYIGSSAVTLGSPARWTMPPDLAGLLWLHNQPPFGSTIRPNPSAVRPLRDLLS